MKVSQVPWQDTSQDFGEGDRGLNDGTVTAFKSCTSREAVVSFALAALHDNGGTVHYPYEVICGTGVLSHSRLKWAIFLGEIAFPSNNNNNNERGAQMGDISVSVKL